MNSVSDNTYDAVFPFSRHYSVKRDVWVDVTKLCFVCASVLETEQHKAKCIHHPHKP